MRKRPLLKEVETIAATEEDTFKIQLEKSKQNKSPPFSEKEVEKVLKSLKSGKCKDPDGYIRDLFQVETIGTDLKESILMMFNKRKVEMVIP
jgi:hypothetical protein